MKKFKARNLWLAVSVSIVVLLGMAPSLPPVDPLVGTHYELAVGGAAVGYFTEVDGIGSENEVVEHKVVDDSGKEVVQKIPGRLKFLDVTLKRGITASQDIWTWRAEVEEGKMSTARKNVSIILYDQNLTPVAQWDLLNAWPSKVVQSSTAGTTAVEELTLVNEGCTRVPR